jgi:hypothetical protein
LDSKNHYYLEREMPVSEQQISAEKNQKTIDPCKQFVGADCVLLKKVKINGRAAEKWLITLDNNGRDFHIFQWIDVKYKSILRQENSDGTGLNVEIVDDQEVNGRKVRKLTMVAYSANGEQKGVQWYDDELDIVVKQQYENDVIDELQNIKVNKVNKALFTIPDGYTLYDAVDKTMKTDEVVKVTENK